MDFQPKKNTTISINGGPEIPVDVVRVEGDRLRVKEKNVDQDNPVLPSQGIELSQTFELDPSGYEFLVRHSLGEFNA